MTINIGNGKRMELDRAKLAVSGAMGPVSDRFRFYYAPLFFPTIPTIPGLDAPPIIDISEYVQGFSFSWDADAAKRSGSIEIDMLAMPVSARSIIQGYPSDLMDDNTFYDLVKNIGQGCIFACHEILIDNVWRRWPIGWFIARDITYTRSGFDTGTLLNAVNPVVIVNSQIGSSPAKLELLDLTSYFDTMRSETSYQIAAGVEYMAALKQIVIDSGFYDYINENITGNTSFRVGLWSIGPCKQRTSRATTFTPGTTWRAIMDSLTEGCNYFPLFTTPDGEFTTGERIRPGLKLTEDYHGSQMNMRKATLFQPGAGQRYAEGISWNGDIVASAGFSFPQLNLWNQVVTQSSFADSTFLRVAQIKDPDSLLDETNIGTWITKELTVDNAANVGVLLQIAEWYAYYADFHSVQLEVETPISFFVDRRVTPYTRASVGYDWRSGYQSYWDYAELSWSVSNGDTTMKRTYGSSPKFYFPILDNPASPS